METVYKLCQNNQGWYIAQKVPMNDLPGCGMFFWQQISPYYLRRGNAIRFLMKKEGLS